MAIVRDEVCEVLLESQKNGARALRRTQWAVFWVLELALYGRLLAKEISAVTVSHQRPSVVVSDAYTHRKTDRRADRQTEGQSDRQRDGRTYRQTDGQTDRRAGTHTHTDT